MPRASLPLHSSASVPAAIPSSSGARRAFTMIEMLIVVAITALVSAAAITYTRVGQNEVALSVEKSKVAEIILQARELSLATYSGVNNRACAYGVHFDFAKQAYSLFAYTVSGGGRCSTLASVRSGGLSPSNISEYAAGSWQMPLSQGVQVLAPGSSGTAGDVLTDVMFYPPAPVTLITRDNTGSGGTFMSPTQASRIYLRTVDGADSATISVSPEGQVSF